MAEPNIGSGKIVHEQHPLLKVPQKRGAGTAALAAAVLALGLLAGCAAPLPAPSAPVRDVAGDLVPENDEQARRAGGEARSNRAAPAFVEGAGPGPAGQPGAYRWARARSGRGGARRCGGDVGRCGQDAGSP